MAIRERPRSRAITADREMQERARRELVDARRARGIGRRELAEAVGLSEGQVERFEVGADRDVGLGRIARIAVGLGLSPSLRFYPAGNPVRDAGQLRLSRRWRDRLAATCRWRGEVAIPGALDARAWDGIVDGTGCCDGVELETRLGDLQATHRRVQLKLRDDPFVQHAFLVVADTRHDRRVLREAREELRSTFPLDTGPVLAAFAQGRCPGAGGVVML